MSKGIPADQALQSGYKALDFMVTKQAAVLSYMDAFLYLGIMFLICIPFVLMVKGNKGPKMNMSEAMH
jgi:DHA2 family multidrug resistance protein